MKSIVFLAALLSVCLAIPHKGVPTQSTVPTLHKIEQYTFAKPYSCSGSYKTSALYLSSYSLSINHPELLFNSDGGCGGVYFDVMLAGDDFGLIGDFGEFPIENMTAHATFQRGAEYAPTAPAVVGHTYVALLSRSDSRALYTFTVLSYDPSTYVMDIEYAVLSYSLVQPTQSSPGFGWMVPNA